jgi:hypothetical protein
MPHQPREGDFGVTPGSGLAMWFVRAGTGEPPFINPAWAGHAALCIGAEGERVLISEATPDKGIRERWIWPQRGAPWRWSAFELTDGQRRQLVDEARRLKGVPYDWPSIAAFLARFWVKQWKGHAQDHPDQKLFCSEYISWMYRDKMTPGLELVPGVAPGTTAPTDLDRIITDHGWQF